MLKNIVIKSALSVSLLATSVAASDHFPPLDPLAASLCAKQARVREGAVAFEALSAKLQDTLTDEQLKMKAVLETLSALTPEVEEGPMSAGSSAVVGSDLELVVTGNMQSYPTILQAFLGAEIPNVFDPRLQGCRMYMTPGISLAQAEKAPLITFLANKTTVSFCLADVVGFGTFPNGNPMNPGMPLALEAALQGTSIADYIKDQAVQAVIPFKDELTTGRLAGLLNDLNAYMGAAPRLAVTIQSDLDFHKKSLETMMKVTEAGLPKTAEGAEASNRQIEVMMAMDPAPMAVHTKEIQEARSKLEILSPIVAMIEDLKDLMKRVGNIS